MCLPLTNHIYSRRIRSGRMFLILRAKDLAIIVYLILRSVMGLQFIMIYGLPTLGMNLILPLFINYPNDPEIMVSL